MSVFKEFQEFISRGNVVDLAVAVVIGAAFGKIVTSFVNDIIMPPIGMLTGGMDFGALKLILKPGNAIAKIAEVSINYGTFINTIIQFLIIAAAIFLMVRLINNLQRKSEEAPPAPAGPTTEDLLTQIRDLLANRGPS
ncbi:MAG TPA: large-conductance mechanosensitive channel protein MscL [Caulobacteraceae bacterium]|jgi:large conductance mechanosensitive channel